MLTGFEVGFSKTSPAPRTIGKYSQESQNRTGETLAGGMQRLEVTSDYFTGPL